MKRTDETAADKSYDTEQIPFAGGKGKITLQPMSSAEITSVQPRLHYAWISAAVAFVTLLAAAGAFL